MKTSRIIAICLTLLLALGAVTAIADTPWNPADGLILRGTVLTQDAQHTVIEGGAAWRARVQQDARPQHRLRARDRRRPPAGARDHGRPLRARRGDARRADAAGQGRLLGRPPLRGHRPEVARRVHRPEEPRPPPAA